MTAHRSNDWDQVLTSVPWLVGGDEAVSVGEARRWDRPLVSALPMLSRLLAEARLTPVSIAGEAHELLAWDLADGTSIGWICPPPAPEVDAVVHPLQAELWQVLGGIGERWNEPEDTWLLSHNAALTAELAASDPAEAIAATSWAWEEEGLEVPIEPREYGVLAEEANGNLTLCHRTTGEILLFAPDHFFDHVEVLPGCPEYTLYRLPAAPTLATWLEVLATQWLTAISR